VLRRKAIDAVVAAAEVDGGPDEATLRELGLAAAEPAPEGGGADDAGVEDAADAADASA